ncbi:hypothetical protein P280DRAFT_471560 [Massarina eburnea CBS 473.64]|uniref:Acyltransferase 3 domain-containing protein n=1 Tax=Massarina eburnea CBS 473.64 TaxID=1395130 RepID=A0A6A6RSJ6_9PLEO|nr:hypothetical protein P280DRAFT_471560 [Massarina eburnea CBS 473.64]
MIFLPKAPQAIIRHFLLRFAGAPDTSTGAPRPANMSARDNRQNIKWVEGVRGVASFLVVVTHLARAWDYGLFWPSDGPEEAPRLLQLPILRIPFQGRIGVMMFSFLTGYVCAIKPLRQIKSGQTSAALTTIAKSAFRRPPRLIMPATIALVIAWLVTQLDGFQVAKVCDSDWLRDSSPAREGGLGHEMLRLMWDFQNSWIHGTPSYDEHQWALLPFLKGAFLIYMTLAATCYMKFRARALTIFVLWAWFWCSNDWKTETFECMFLYGVLLCDIGSEVDFREYVNSRPKARRIVQTSLIALGLYVGSYPEGNIEFAAWSRGIDQFNFLFPADNDPPKRWSAIAWHLIVLGFWLSPTLQTIFSNKLFMWLGRNSFAVYLTHGTLLRAVLVRFIYGFSIAPFSMERPENADPIYHWIPRTQNWFAWTVAIPLWFSMLYVVAHLWTTYVDAWCAKVTRWLEELMFEKEEEEKPRGAGLV